MAIVLNKQKKKTYSYEEYKDFNKDKHRFWEYEDGRIIKITSPSFKHQITSRKILFCLSLYVEKHNLGEIIDNYAVKLGNKEYIPDIAFFSKESIDLINDLEIENVVPQLVVEILSPSSSVRDKTKKFSVYENFGVKEYWIIDPDDKYAKVYTLEDNQYVLFCNAVNKETIKSKLFGGLEIELSEILP